MSWIAPTFDDETIPLQPQKKKSKITNTDENDPSLSEATKIYEIPSSPTSTWLEEYKPKKISDLAIHIKKIKELEEWLHQSIKSNSKSRFLLLTGPSGCGKTTMLKTVCKSSGFRIMEWITPLDRHKDTLDDTEFSSKFEFSTGSSKLLFEEFLFRSSRYVSCLSSSHVKKLVLVKDFPNTFIHNPLTFHEVLENIFEKCMTPVVFICSDEALCRKLFPVTLKANCHMQSLALNPIPDQRILKVLKSIISHESKKNSSLKLLTDEIVNEVCVTCQGDLRSAILKLNLLSRNGKLKFSQSTSKSQLKKASEASTTETPTHKDQRIDFFHGVGRVLYPKKVVLDNKLKFVHSTEAIVETFLSEPFTFLSQLHENYPGKLGSVEDLRDAAEKMSKSDLLMSRWQERDIFSHYALAVAVQGLMVSNRAPQKARFEAFRKSQTSRMQIDSKAIELEGKAVFSELHALDYGSLVDILPYARLLLPNLSMGQMDYIQKTSVFR